MAAKMARRGIRTVPYVVIRGNPAWNGAEWDQIAECVSVCGSVILNLEPGTPYWNGLTTPTYVQNWLDGMRRAMTELGVGAAPVELCTIPRTWVFHALGGEETMRTWLRGVQRASWECYDGVASDLNYTESMKRVQDLIPANTPEYQIPLVQRNRVGVWQDANPAGVEVWYLDGDI